MTAARTAREVLDKGMTEDELLTGITDALTLYQYVWVHHRRSDKAITQGHAGLPDIIAARNGVVWFIELKAAHNRLSPEQFSWFHALGWPDPKNVHLRVWFPADYDAALKELA